MNKGCFGRFNTNCSIEKGGCKIFLAAAFFVILQKELQRFLYAFDAVPVSFPSKSF